MMRLLSVTKFDVFVPNDMTDEEAERVYPQIEEEIDRAFAALETHLAENFPEEGLTFEWEV